MQILLPYPLSIFAKLTVCSMLSLSVCVSLAFLWIQFHWTILFFSILFFLCALLFIWQSLYPSHIAECPFPFVVVVVRFLFGFMFVLEIEHVFAIRHHHHHLRDGVVISTQFFCEYSARWI